ncbi:MAG TPA: hypothetical protein VJ962_02625 [Clostridia bacterium]|nr:hypothetical protein [Clostridia bacterium]
MRYDFRKLGIKILIFSVLFLVLLNQLPVSINIKLFLGTLLIGSSVFLIFFGQFNPADHDYNEPDDRE